MSPEIISYIPFIDLQEVDGKGFSNNSEMSNIGLCDIEKAMEKFRLFFNPPFPSCCSSGSYLQTLGSLEAENQMLLLKIRIAWNLNGTRPVLCVIWPTGRRIIIHIKSCAAAADLKMIRV